MNNDRFNRTRLLVGEAGVERLRHAAVAVIGLGGVGSYAAEAIARAGVGRLLLVDGDRVEQSNINRQLYALDTTVGRAKTDVARERIALINPAIQMEAVTGFVTADTLDALALAPGWRVIDAIDTLSSKVALLRFLCARNIACVSAMGAALRRDPTRIRVADLRDTRGCPLARLTRQELRRHGVERGIPCVFSDEPPLKQESDGAALLSACGKAPLGSIAHIPALIGLTAAGLIINDILDASAP